MTILVTGSSRGIGLEITSYYLKQGYNVIGLSRSESAIVDEKYYHYVCDLTSKNQMEKTIFEIKNKHKNVDILINNAGIASMNHIIFTSYETVDKIFKTNFQSIFLLTREISKLMMRNGFGRIVNFSTVAVPLNLDGEAIYASSKAAVEAFTKISAKEFADSNITVNCIGPSPVKTALIANVGERKINDLLQKQTIKKHGTFEDIFNVIDFFISEKSSNITGQVIYLGGVS
jgi:3-oxoacyl-[acyl-carrier protein] reductase